MAIGLKNSNGRIEWMCTTCGKKHTKMKRDGRPMPGSCIKKTNGRPHTWVKNREWN